MRCGISQLLRLRPSYSYKYSSPASPEWITCRHICFLTRGERRLCIYYSYGAPCHGCFQPSLPKLTPKQLNSHRNSCWAKSFDPNSKHIESFGTPQVILASTSRPCEVFRATIPVKAGTERTKARDLNKQMVWVVKLLPGVVSPFCRD